MPFQRTLDLVTVVYEQEIPLLKTQALSMSLRFQPGQVNRIIILVNGHPSVVEQIEHSWFGHHSDRVRIMTQRSFDYKPRRGVSGWSSQQLMKLLGVAASDADWCLVLDAKTWFVKDYSEELLFKDDKARFGWDDVQETFRTGLRYTKSLFFSNFIEEKSLGPLGVPFLMKPSVVREMMGRLERLSDQSFVDWFEINCSRAGNAVTEFTCYSAYVSHAYPDDTLYAGDQIISVHNLADWQIGEFDDWYSSILDPSAFTVSIQDRAVPLLTDKQWSRWQIFLRQRGLA